MPGGPFSSAIEALSSMLPRCRCVLRSSAEPLGGRVASVFGCRGTTLCQYSRGYAPLCWGGPTLISKEITADPPRRVRPRPQMWKTSERRHYTALYSSARLTLISCNAGNVAGNRTPAPLCRCRQHCPAGRRSERTAWRGGPSDIQRARTVRLDHTVLRQFHVPRGHRSGQSLLLAILCAPKCGPGDLASTICQRSWLSPAHIFCKVHSVANAHLHVSTQCIAVA